MKSRSDDSVSQSDENDSYEENNSMETADSSSDDSDSADQHIFNEITFNEESYVLSINGYKILSTKKIQEINQEKEEIVKGWDKIKGRSFYFTDSETGEPVLLKSCKNKVIKVTRQGLNKNNTVCRAYFKDETVHETITARNLEDYKKILSNRQEESPIPNWEKKDSSQQPVCIVFDEVEKLHTFCPLKKLPREQIEKVFRRGPINIGNNFAHVNGVEIRIFQHQSVLNNPNFMNFFSAEKRRKRAAQNTVEKNKEKVNDFIFTFNKHYKCLSNEKIQEIRHAEERLYTGNWKLQQSCYFHFIDPSTKKLIKLTSRKDLVKKVTVEGIEQALLAPIYRAYFDENPVQIMRCDDLEEFNEKIKRQENKQQLRVLNWEEKKKSKKFVCLVFNIKTQSYERYDLKKIPGVEEVFQEGENGDYFAVIGNTNIRTFIYSTFNRIKEFSNLIKGNIAEDPSIDEKNQQDNSEFKESDFIFEFKNRKCFTNEKIQEIRHAEERPYTGNWERPYNGHFHFIDPETNELIKLTSRKRLIKKITIEGADKGDSAIFRAYFDNGPVQIIRCNNLEEFNEKIESQTNKKELPVDDWDIRNKPTQKFVCLVYHTKKKSCEMYYVTKIPGVERVFQKGENGDYFAVIGNINIRVFLYSRFKTLKEFSVLTNNKKKSKNSDQTTTRITRDDCESIEAQNDCVMKDVDPEPVTPGPVTEDATKEDDEMMEETDNFSVSDHDFSRNDKNSSSISRSSTTQSSFKLSFFSSKNGSQLNLGNNISAENAPLLTPNNQSREKRKHEGELPVHKKKQKLDHIVDSSEESLQKTLGNKEQAIVNDPFNQTNTSSEAGFTKNRPKLVMKLRSSTSLPDKVIHTATDQQRADHPISAEKLPMNKHFLPEQTSTSTYNIQKKIKINFLKQGVQEKNALTPPIENRQGMDLDENYDNGRPVAAFTVEEKNSNTMNYPSLQKKKSS